MDWTKEKSLQLIEEYRKMSLLWDVRHEFYFSKMKKEDAWRAIAYKFKMNTEEIKKKMASLLGSFRRERSKLRSSISGKPSTEIYHSNWFGFEHLKFLLDRDDPIRVLLAEDTTTNDMVSASGDPVRNEPDGDNLFHCSPIASPRKGRRMKRRKVIRENSQIGKALKMFKNSCVPDSDYCTVYGNHIANKLRKYSENTRIYVEHIINTTLFEADIGKYENYFLADLQSSAPSNNSLTLNNVINSTTPAAFTLPGHSDPISIKNSPCLNAPPVSANQYNPNNSYHTTIHSPITIRQSTSTSTNPLLIEPDDVKIQTENMSFN